MAEYISREAAEYAMCAACEYYCKPCRRASGKSQITADTCCHLRDLYAIPAADVAPIVRCKDCKHSYEDLMGRCCAFGACVDCIVPDDFFCAYGVKMDESEDDEKGGEENDEL